MQTSAAASFATCSNGDLLCFAQVRVRLREGGGAPEVDVVAENTWESASRLLVAEMMILAGEVIGDLGACSSGHNCICMQPVFEHRRLGCAVTRTLSCSARRCSSDCTTGQ